MSDPIGAARAALSAAGEIGLQDGPRRYTVDIGKAAPASGSGSFSSTIEGFINQVSDAQDRSGALRDALLRGEPVELHQVTATATEARIALDLMVELRNKVLEAYRTLITMQG